MRKVPSAIGAFATIALGFGALAGDLNPPAGLVTPTMKTIEEAEPRRFIEQADIPLTINQSGSYYLRENLLPVGIFVNNIITVVASNVTIDLRGFTIEGATEVSQAIDGIEIPDTVDNVTIKNGSIVKCGGDGISTFLATNCRAINLSVLNCGDDGIELGAGARVINCIVSDCGDAGISVLSGDAHIESCLVNRAGRFGIIAGPRSVVLGCSVNETMLEGGTGFDTRYGVVVENCTASNNVGDGFRGQSGTTFRGCTAVQNGRNGIQAFNANVIIGCAARENADDGISVSRASQVINCVADQNGDNGIFLSQNCEARNCMVRENGLGTNNSGIRIGVSQCRVEGNHLIGNHFGVTGSVGGTTLVVRNTFTDQVSSNITVSTANHNVIGQLFDYTGGGIIASLTQPSSDGNPPSYWSNFLIDTFP